jgi:hypothetical protein
VKQKVFAFILTLAVFLSLTPCVGAAAVRPEGVPDSLETAIINQVQVLKDEDGVPNFQLEIKFPQSFLDLSEASPAEGYTWIDYYWKIDNGSWEYMGGGKTDSLLDEGYGNVVAGKENTYKVSGIYPEDEGNSREINIKDHSYTIRVQLAYGYPDGENSQIQFVTSPASNEVSIGSGSYYKKVPDWAKPELQKADELGLIPDILAGADMTKPVTRGEFCELAVVVAFGIKLPFESPAIIPALDMYFADCNAHDDMYF